jgi:hypothetical protein
MAFRSVAVTNVTTATSDLNLPAGYQAGDYLLCVWSSDLTTAPTPPSGKWTERARVTHTVPDTHQVVYYDRIADGTEGEGGGANSWTWTGSTSNVVFLAAYTGRDTGGTPIRFITTTDYQTADASPVTANLSSGSASDGDDIAVFLGLDLQNAGSNEWTCAPPAGDAVNGAYTERADSHPQSWVAATMATFDDSGAGALGTISLVATRSSAGTAAYSGIVVALAAEGEGIAAPFTPPTPADFFRTRLR